MFHSKQNDNWTKLDFNQLLKHSMIIDDNNVDDNVNDNIVSM